MDEILQMSEKEQLLAIYGLMIKNSDALNSISIRLVNVENKINHFINTNPQPSKSQIDFIKAKGGSDEHDLTYNILAAVFTNELASEYSFHGQKKKKKFKDLKLNSCIIMAARSTFAKATEDSIINSIKI